MKRRFVIPALFTLVRLSWYRPRPRPYFNVKVCVIPALEDAESIAAYGIKENEKNYTNIKPGRIGTVTALGTDKITFIDNTMFDLTRKKRTGKQRSI